MRKTATTPNPGVQHAVDNHGALSIRQIGIVVSLEPLAGRPVIAANPFRLPRSNTPSKRSIGRPCSNHWIAPAPSFSPRGQDPDHVALSSGAGFQSHSRQPVCGSRSQLPSSHGAVQLICSESGSTTVQSRAKVAVAASVSARTRINSPQPRRLSLKPKMRGRLLLGHMGLGRVPIRPTVHVAIKGPRKGGSNRSGWVKLGNT